MKGSGMNIQLLIKILVFTGMQGQIVSWASSYRLEGNIFSQN
jgi:hypothetical protein